jgi:signal recognition particle subunit SRP72
MQRIAWFNYLLATCHDPRVVRTRMWDWKDCQPFTYQGAAMYHNDLALDFEREKYHAVRSSTEKVLSNNDGDRISGKTIVAGYFHAASRGHRELSDGDKHSIKPLLSTAPFLLKDRPLDVGLVLVIVQFYIMMDNTAAAVDALESLLSGLEASSTPGDAAARFSPGLIAILVTLYDRQGRSSDIKSELTKVATYHRSNNSVAGMPPSLLTAMGIALLDKDESSNESSNESNNESSDESSDLELAHDLFTTYHSSHPDSVIAIAGLAATAKSATSVSAKLLSKLPSIAELTAGIDAAALEAAGVAVMPDHLSPSTPGKRPGTPNPSKRPAPASATKTPPSGKHKKGRLSKDYDEMKTPDSERWTPVRDRTNFRPKGKKKAGGRSLGGALQGSPSGYQAGDEGPGTPAQGAGTVLAGKGRKGRKR